MALNPFEQLQNVAIEPRQAFEEVATRIIELVKGGTRRIRVYGGDGGVDSFCGEFGSEGEVEVYQVKYFPTAWTDSQRQQVRDSYSRAAASSQFRLKRWFLVVPTRLPAKDVLYFDQWARSCEPKPELIDGDQLTEMLVTEKCAPVRQQLTGIGVAGLVSSGVHFSGALTVQNPGPKSGRVCNLYVHLKNEGEVSATNLRVDVTHSETGCVHGGINSEWWSSTGGILNPRSLRALHPINPEVSTIVMEIPIVERSAFPVWVEITASAQDTKPAFFHAVIARELLTAGCHIEMESGRVPASPPEKVRPEPCTPGGKLILDEILKCEDEEDRGLSFVPDGMPGKPLIIMFSASVSRKVSLMGLQRKAFEEGVNELLSLGLLEFEVEAGDWLYYRYVPDAES